MRRIGAIVTAALALCSASCAGAQAAPRAPVTTTAARERAGGTGWRAAIGSLGPLTTDGLGTVVFASDKVVALAPDGAVQWATPVAHLGIQYPAINHGLVVVSTVIADERIANGEFVALDRATGRQRWRVPVAAEPGPVTLTSTAIFAATTDGVVRALARDGTAQWTARLPGAISSRGNLAFEPLTNTVSAVVLAPGHGWFVDVRDARDGHERAALDLGATDPPSAVVAAGDGNLVVGDGDTHELIRIDVRRRIVASALRTTDGFDPASVPAVDGDLAVVVDRSGGITAMDLRDGHERWHADLGGPVLDARPLIAAGRVAASRWLGPVVVFGRNDGRPLPFAAAGDGMPASFALDRDHVIEALRFARPDRVEARRAP